MTCNNTFHGDGISIPLFHHLWRKNKKSKLKINIPDTVIYLFGHASGKIYLSVYMYLCLCVGCAFYIAI